ncbi:MAG TPA: AAA family ATPase [Candidatus Saccharimonadales bacterium]|nr:AAA family ATPase [Candidatus Saccharimonadales bacterium]
MKAAIYILNGPGGAGKTTTARLLAEQLERCALIEVDEIRKLIVQGESDPFSKEGQAQLILSSQNAAQLARNFYDNGFTVIIDDCVTDKERLDYYCKTLHELPFKIFLILPTQEALISRDNERKGRSKLGRTKIEWLYQRFVERANEEQRWEIIDNTHLTATETVKRLQGI